MTNTSKGLSRTYTLIGNAYDDFNPEWYYETIQSHQTGQITTGSDLPDEDSIIWFFNIPGQEQQRQVDDCVAEAQAVEAAAVDEVAVADEAMPAAEIAIEAVSAFVLPIPVTLVNIALSLIW
ncbi:MAG: hypothetical protein Q4F54_04800 [Coriobacteriia bacterium]|nr:hypothetical protein [Coriobacteriia bacterium]